jgi:hypothetical protein
MGSSQIDWLMAGIVQSNPPAEVPGGGAAWESILDRITGWKQDPGSLEDEGVRAPSSRVLQQAEDFARELHQRRIEAPTVVVPNGDGGVILRWRDGHAQWSIEFEEDGFVESYLVVAGKVQCRHGLQTAC